ncbi:MAG: hypothetical protein LAO07_19875 [Acidobacteriia bacterium]|nr:hypothetical protein [Terriglobia bacterium]
MHSRSRNPWSATRAAGWWKAGLDRRAEDWRWPSVREYMGTVGEAATRHPILPIDRVLLPTDQNTRI